MRERAFATRTSIGPSPVNTSSRGCQPLRTTAARPCSSRRGELRQKLTELGLQCLGDQLPGSFAQHRAQQILPLWLLQRNYRILLHGGVTPFVDAELDIGNRIPAGHAAFFNSSSYTRFGYTSSFNRSVYSTYGAIDDYWRNDDELDVTIRYVADSLAGEPDLLQVVARFRRDAKR